MNRRRVCWLHRSTVYHHAKFRESIMGLRVPCGVLISRPGFRPNEGTETQARRFGLTPCRRCLSDVTYSTRTGGTS